MPDRSVPHGLAFIRDAFASGFEFFVRSDISGFFDNIPRLEVLKEILEDTGDSDFVDLLHAATTVTLQNEEALGENRAIFPTDADGVAQGSPLSALFGNILLGTFDDEFNQREIQCVRFVDDFVLLGNSEHRCKKAFRNSVSLLGELGLSCHDPYSGKASKDKAAFGPVAKGFVFLGYDIRPGLFQPSKKARDNLRAKIRKQIELGKRSIIEAIRSQDSYSQRQRFHQVMVTIDRIIRGWGNSFAYGNASDTIASLDRLIDEDLTAFESWFDRVMTRSKWKDRRRGSGVGLLGDLKTKSLDDLPMRLSPGRHFRRSRSTVIVSTDGSVIRSSKASDQGPGGWAYVLHEGPQYVAGSEPDTTNNRMELTAVLRALSDAPANRSVLVRTDSQYVANGMKEETVHRKNLDLWKAVETERESRGVKVEWIRGHVGDPYNERADQLARAAAEELASKTD